jgi:hypothetical protein
MDAISYAQLLASLGTIGFMFYLIERRLFPDEPENNKPDKNKHKTHSFSKKN